MTRELRYQVLTRDSDTRGVDAPSVVEALASFVAVIREVASTYSDVERVDIRFTALSVGSIGATLEYELRMRPDSIDEAGNRERDIERTYLEGWASLVSGPVVPRGFSRSALEAVSHCASLFASGEFHQLTITGAAASVTVTPHFAANIQGLLGARRREGESVEGRLMSISLAGPGTFTLRDELSDQVVNYAIGAVPLATLTACLGMRVLVHGEVTFDATGAPTEVCAVQEIQRLTGEGNFEHVRGLGRGLTDDRPAELLARESWG